MRQTKSINTYFLRDEICSEEERIQFLGQRELESLVTFDDRRVLKGIVWQDEFNAQ